PPDPNTASAPRRGLWKCLSSAALSARSYGTYRGACEKRCSVSATDTYRGVDCPVSRERRSAPLVARHQPPLQPHDREREQRDQQPLERQRLGRRIDAQDRDTRRPLE